MRILLAWTHYGETGEGDVKRLTDRASLFRQRVWKWRVFFDLDTPDTLRIHGIDKPWAGVLDYQVILQLPISCNIASQKFFPRAVTDRAEEFIETPAGPGVLRAPKIVAVLGTLDVPVVDGHW
jgi:hypothetical protein